MNRRDLIQKLAVFPLAVMPLVQCVKLVDVTTLEHDPITQYYVRWQFADVDSAEEFVRSLIPKVSLLILRKNLPEQTKRISSIRSGYRHAVRVQLSGDLVCYQAGIWSKLTEDWAVKHRVFDTIGSAWGYLEGIRVNGQPVSRGGSNKLSEYLTQPFLRGNPEIEYI